MLNTRRADLPSHMTFEEAKRGGYVVCEEHFKPDDLEIKVLLIFNKTFNLIHEIKWVIFLVSVLSSCKQW